MDSSNLTRLLNDLRSGKRTVKQVARMLAAPPAESLAYATVDHHRGLRQGFPEVIFCEGKTPAQVAGIAASLQRAGSIVFGTRASRQHLAAVRRKIRGTRYNPVARTIVAREHLVTLRGRGTILVVTAGTSDIPVAEEALETARVMGNRTDALFDVGVAGIHRVLSRNDKLRSASVIIVVAGMEGALASVVGGLVDVPVIAVPTSVGYGASFQGISALLGMLNSCAAGVTVVNIDNGFGAGVAASLINRIRVSE